MVTLHAEGQHSESRGRKSCFSQGQERMGTGTGSVCSGFGAARKGTQTAPPQMSKMNWGPGHCTPSCPLAEHTTSKLSTA
jgi:hypothetical protein